MAFYTKTVQEMIEESINIFDFSYDLYDVTKKIPLQQMFTRHYYFYEIGYESVSQFKYALREKWLLLLPKYNKLWVENEKTLDILKGFNVEVESETILKDTPITEYDDTDFATAKQKGSNKSSGRNQSEIDLIENYNQKLRNINQQFINEFIKLFMGIM
ncbi:MAG: Lower collar protein [Candidatus Moranbacteria bacterium GW2011_GWF2_35_39]|nr:MAG: Lower collar protein [Candidatus Moranbacteria bacterium GW2011_GWF2_35_39]